MPPAMLSQVHLLVEKNKTDEARRLCETILSQYRESLVAGEAARQLRLLGIEKPAAQALNPAGRSTRRADSGRGSKSFETANPAPTKP